MSDVEAQLASSKHQTACLVRHLADARIVSVRRAAVSMRSSGSIVAVAVAPAGSSPEAPNERGMRGHLFGRWCVFVPGPGPFAAAVESLHSGCCMTTHLAVKRIVPMVQLPSMHRRAGGCQCRHGGLTNPSAVSAGPCEQSRRSLADGATGCTSGDGDELQRDSQDRDGNMPPLGAGKQTSESQVGWQHARPHWERPKPLPRRCVPLSKIFEHARDPLEQASHGLSSNP